MKNKLNQWRRNRLAKKYPKWGSRIIDIYTYNELLVVVTELDLFVTENGVNYERVNVNK